VNRYLPLFAFLLLASCLPAPGADLTPAAAAPTLAAGPSPTPLATRPAYDPGELVDYTAQMGDTLPALAAHFNTTIEEIRQANPQIPADATTMPPGMPMKIPIYYLPLWGTSFQIIPDNLFVNGPSMVEFDTASFVAQQPGWLKDFRDYVGGKWRSGAQVVDYVALNFSVSPRLLLAILEYQTGALSNPEPPASSYPLGYRDLLHVGLYLQLIWAANTLNNGYYGWRTGSLASFEHPDGSLERPDPWQNAATVGFQYYFSRLHPKTEYDRAIGPEGLAKTFRDLFGDPWAMTAPHIPVSLKQPALLFPFPAGEAWTYTGGPHTGWGKGEPFAALDFAPPASVGGCLPTDKWSTAVADGVVTRSGDGVVTLDLDGDGDERTGWVILYLHVGAEGRAPVGAKLKTGDPLGHSSCEGGRTTGTHIHLARKYNGEWMPADGALAFNLEGWIAHNGSAAYKGTLTRSDRTVTACECSDLASQVTAGK
jgi:murein DD-endopeptidase MepM/ murein hydrolase activator NlpD